MDIEKHYKLEKIKTSNQLRIEEYKDSRAEGDALIKDTRNLEIYAIIGIVAYYAWLLTHCVSPPFAWSIPIVIPVLGGWRSLENLLQVLRNESYLMQLENEVFSLGFTKGWENYLAEKRNLDNKKKPAWRDVFKIEGSTARLAFWTLLIS